MVPALAKASLEYRLHGKLSVKLATLASTPLSHEA